MLKFQYHASFNRNAIAQIIDFKNACIAQASISPALARLSRTRYIDYVYATRLDIATQDRLVFEFNLETHHLMTVT